MNLVFLVGLFVLPRFVADEHAAPVKLAAIATGGLVFLYANYGGAVAVLPAPATVVGPVATVRLTDETTGLLLGTFNSVVFGPAVVALFGAVMNRVLTRPELADIPLVEYALPRRDPDAVVLTSAAAGTVFYLAVVALLTGSLVVVP
jgi:hypothetical protein